MEMLEMELFRRQFILTDKDQFDLSWRSEKIMNYTLFYHPELEFTHLSNKNLDIYLLGFIYDYMNPEFSNKQVLDSFSGIDSLDQFIRRLAQYSGHFIVILRLKKRLILMGDACGQYEIYYDTTFSTFGSQPKLMGKVIPLEPHSSPEAREFYSPSKDFMRQRLFVGDTTHVENIKHLLPNHYIDIESQSITRYYPNTTIKPISIDVAVPIAIKMLQGFIKAASLRNNIYMGLTAGYDSRVLFLTSLNTKCRYYVTKHEHMDDEYYEINIPERLTKLFNKDFRVVVESPMDDDMKKALEQSIDFPRELTKPDIAYKGKVLINGNLSEIARNSYGRLKRVNAKDMAHLREFHGNKYVYQVYGKWKERSSKTIMAYGYHILDLFYWEERMGLWASKSKTEGSAIGTIIYSPFCSHNLLTTLLSTPRKLRNKYYNVLYNSIIKSLSPEAARIPINPSLKKRIYRLSHRLRFYRIIQRIRFIIKALYKKFHVWL
jgi:hypothetical protein